MRRSASSLCFAWLFLAWALTLAACAPPAAGPGKSGKGGQPAEDAELIEESWEAVFAEREGDDASPSIQRAKVGHTQTRVEKCKTGKRDVRRITQVQNIEMLRFGQDTSFHQRLEGDETSAGELIDFESITKASTGEMAVRGEVIGGRLEMKFETQGKSLTRQVAWDKSWGGVYAVVQSLRDKPLATGQSRDITSLTIDLPFPSATKTTLTALAVEETELLDGRRDLLKVGQSIDFGEGKIIEVLAWVDEQGEVLKSRIVSGIPLTFYRVSKETALRKPTGPKFDLGVISTVKVSRPPGENRTVYKATLKEGGITDAFASGASQTVRIIDKQTAEIVVRRVRPDDPQKLEAPEAPPTAADREPNSFIQSDDRHVVALANAMAKGETDPWKVALALERHVKQSVKSSFSQAFATAAETAASLEGDCTEHAMLLAAVCRARKVPARVAVGLVYDGKDGFAFHMWTEVWISDRWIPLDATRGAGGIGGAHLKLAHTNLKVSSMTTALFAVFSVLGRLELEITEAE